MVSRVRWKNLSRIVEAVEKRRDTKRGGDGLYLGRCQRTGAATEIRRSGVSWDVVGNNGRKTNAHRVTPCVKQRKRRNAVLSFTRNEAARPALPRFASLCLALSRVDRIVV